MEEQIKAVKAAVKAAVESMGISVIKSGEFFGMKQEK